MTGHNLPKVVTKNDFPRLGVEPGSLDPKANTAIHHYFRKFKSLAGVNHTSCAMQIINCSLILHQQTEKELKAHDSQI